MSYPQSDTATTAVLTEQSYHLRHDASLAPPVPDSELLCQARRGCNAAFEELHRRYSRLVRHIAREELHSTWACCEDVDDLEAAAWTRVHAALPRFDMTRAFKPWVSTIVRNLCRNENEKQAGRRTQTLTDAEAGRNDDGDCPAAEREPVFATRFPDPRTAAADAEAEYRVRMALATLSPAQRQVMEMALFGDLSYAEIARSTGVPLGTVLNRAASARQSLRHWLVAPRVQDPKWHGRPGSCARTDTDKHGQARTD
jgi:RNA polymerase sigma-70 factor (ECF subfamily)